MTTTTGSGPTVSATPVGSPPTAGGRYRTSTRSLDTGHRLHLASGHVTTLGRLRGLPAEDGAVRSLPVIASATDSDGWTVQVARSDDPGDAVNGAFRTVAVAITDPTGRTEILLRGVRHAWRGPEILADLAAANLGALFEGARLNPPDSDAVHDAWVRARRVHALAADIIYRTDQDVPNGQHWWTHPRVLDWAGYPDRATASAWRAQVDDLPEWAQPYQAAGMDPAACRTWVILNVPVDTARTFMAAGWDDARPARRLIAALGFDMVIDGAFDLLTEPAQPFPDEVVTAYQDWLALGHGPALTVAAAEAGLTRSEAATVSAADLTTLRAMAALRRGAGRP